MSYYENFKQKFVPPVFIVVFTMSVQLLAIFGRGNAITFEAIVSGLSGNLVAWKIVATLFVWAYFWLIIARKETKGERAPDAFVPTYKNSGVSYYLITVLTFLYVQWSWPNLSSIIFENMTQILGTLNITAFALCIILYLRSTEGSELPKLYIFYRGRQLHPTILNVQVKQLVIYRMALMFWQIQVLAFFFAAVDKRSFDVPTLVTCLIQTAYLFKAFIYEAAYYHTLDITLDRAGYYLIWGTLVWLPCVYSYTSYYLVNHTPTISNMNSVLILIFGITAIIATLLVDFEKARFRQTNGETLIWNKPPTYIVAKYIDSTGAERASLLLTSGSWGLARHLNYTLELLSNLSWTLPAHGLDISVYFFIIFLTVLLFHRIYRDESKCKAKYGRYWKEYCQKVPYRLVPYLF